MVVPTSAAVCGRADGLHRPIERFIPQLRDAPRIRGTRLRADVKFEII